jgi:hypothetical protein
VFFALNSKGKRKTKEEIYFEGIFLHSPGGSLEIGIVENKKVKT